MTAAYRRPALVGLVEEATETQQTAYLAKLPEGPIVVLRDTALTIWREAVDPTGPGSLGDRVAKAYGVPRDDIESYVQACVADLVDRGVLERA